MEDHTQAREVLAANLRTQSIKPSYMRPNMLLIHISDLKGISNLIASLDAEIAALKAEREPFKFLPDCPRERCYLYGCLQENCDWLAALPKPPEGA